MDENESLDASFNDHQDNLMDPTFVVDEDLPCKVCGDKSSGLHYGVMSCEGCKGFFRRSIQKQIDYRCLQSGNCDINRASRNRCQFCRFKKCLAVGMSKDSVRYGRIPKRFKPSDEDRIGQSGSQPAGQRTLSQQDKELAIYDVILTVSQAHHTHCMTTMDKLNIMKRRSTSLCQVNSESLEEQKCGMFQRLAREIAPTVQHMVEFSKHVPGFSELHQDDQLILIKSAFFEMWLSGLARLCVDEGTDHVLTLSDGLQIPRMELETLYSEDFIDAMFTYCHTFNYMKLSDTEIGLFNAVILTSSDRPLLREPKKVERIQDRLIEALNLQISRNHPHETSLFANILMKIPEIRALGSRHHGELDFYRGQCRNLTLPPLVTEIYDIPRPEDEDDQALASQPEQEDGNVDDTSAAIVDGNIEGDATSGNNNNVDNGE